MINELLFVNIITSMQRQLDYDSNCNKAFQQILPHDYVTGYDNTLLFGGTIDLLETLTGDVDKWIEWYVWEVDFGRAKHNVIMQDGIEFKIDTPETLWKLIKGELQ